MKVLFVVLGPTAVGKTEVCMKIAQRLHTPVINADSRQIFSGIPIATAAPTYEQLSLVKHYFVGTCQLSDYYSASKYEEEVMALLAPDGELGKLPFALMSGGSMMYIDAVCNGIDDIPTIDEDTRAMMKHRLDEVGLEQLVSELRLLDPEYYAIVDRKNVRRVVHALEICYMTGKTYTSFRKNKKKQRDFRIVKIGLNRQREELYQRINQRVTDMVAKGLVEEAQRGYPLKGLNSLNTVGLREMFDYIEGRCSLDEAITSIQSNTRRYCRKQLTWFKKDKDINWFHPDDMEGIMRLIDIETETAAKV